MFEAFCRDKLGPLFLRVALGLFFAYHGYSKIMAGGGTAWSPGLHVAWQLLIAWGEFSAGLAILAGFRCRWAASIGLILQLGTLIWFQGWRLLDLPIRSLELSLLVVLATLALLFIGAGQLSIDSRGAKALGKKGA